LSEEKVVYLPKKLGSVWDAQLKKELSEYDIFLCLVSINLLDTPYVIDLEIPEAKILKKTIIPVTIGACNWQDERFGLSDYTARNKGKS
jgi:hypothetical protein